MNKGNRDLNARMSTSLLQFSTESPTVAKLRTFTAPMREDFFSLQGDGDEVERGRQGRRK